MSQNPTTQTTPSFSARLSLPLAVLATLLAVVLHGLVLADSTITTRYTSFYYGFLILAFLASAASVAIAILREQQKLVVTETGSGFLAQAPRPCLVALALSLLYAVIILLDWLPAGMGGRGAGAATQFERVFSAIVGWFALAAACYHAVAGRAARPN